MGTKLKNKLKKGKCFRLLERKYASTFIKDGHAQYAQRVDRNHVLCSECELQVQNDHRQAERETLYVEDVQEWLAYFYTK